MELTKVIMPDTVLCRPAGILNKKKLFEYIGRCVQKANPSIKTNTVVDALNQRERMGLTALGHGVAIPHARIPGIKQPICVVLLLDPPINYAVDDTTWIDIVFSLLAPIKKNKAHLDILSKLTTHLQQKSYREALRNSKNNEILYNEIVRFDTDSH